MRSLPLDVVLRCAGYGGAAIVSSLFLACRAGRDGAVSIAESRLWAEHKRLLRALLRAFEGGGAGGVAHRERVRRATTLQLLRRIEAEGARSAIAAFSRKLLHWRFAVDAFQEFSSQGGLDRAWAAHAQESNVVPPLKRDDPLLVEEVAFRTLAAAVRGSDKRGASYVEDRAFFALAAAVRDDDASAIERLVLDEGVSVDFRPEDGRYPAVHQAAMDGRAHAAAALLRFGASAAVVADNQLPLNLAACYGRASTAVEFLHFAPHVLDLKDDFGATALATAALYSRGLVLVLLLDAGADASIMTTSQRKPVAIVLGHLGNLRRIVDLLPLGIHRDAAERDLSCCTTAVEIMLFKELAEDTGIDVNDPENDAKIAAEIVAGRTPGLRARARAYLAEAPDFDPGAADELLAWLLASFVDLGRPGLAHLH